MGFNLIIPVAADRPEYRSRQPYWLDIHPSGNLFLYETVSGLNLDKFDALYFTVLRSHEKKYQIAKALTLQFEKAGLGSKIKVTVLDRPTRNQPETVAVTIEKEEIEGAIVVKDADNHFQCRLKPGNFICTYPLDALQKVNPGDKSYIAIDDSSFVTNIIEKKIISRWFCTGAYGFESASMFIDYYRKHKHFEKLYISHLIYDMLLDKVSFRPVNITDYLDWGTEKEWKEFKNQFHTLLIPAEMIFANVDLVPYINKLYESSKVSIAILSGKNNLYNDSQLEEHLQKTLELRYHQILTLPQCGNCSLIKSKNEILKLLED